MIIFALILNILVTAFQGQSENRICNTYTIAFQTQMDTSIYNLLMFNGKNDRIPTFYSCGNELGFQIHNLSLTVCLQKSNQFITDVEIKDATIGDLKKGFESGLYFKSKYIIILDKNGLVESVSELEHYLETVNSKELSNWIKKTEWKPGIKGLKPVRSRFILVLNFDTKIRILEDWNNRQRSIKHNLLSYKSVLKKTYLEKGTMWDLDILEPMMKVKNINELIRILDEAEAQAFKIIKEFDREVMSFKYNGDQNSIDNYYNAVGRIGTSVQTKFEETLKYLLKNN